MTTQPDLIEIFEDNPDINEHVTLLREMADWLSANAHLPTPTISPYGVFGEIYWYFWAGEENVKQRAAIIRRAIGGKWDKIYSGNCFELKQKVGTDDRIHLRIITQREDVCEQKITGYEEVVIPAVEAKPERTEQRPIVEWSCTGLLTED